MKLLSEMLGTTELPPDLTTEHLQHVVGVTSPIQQQLDMKSPIDHDHDGTYEPVDPDLVRAGELISINLNGGYF